MYEWVVRELARRRPVAVSMSHLIDQCERVRPHPDWAHLRGLPYAELSALITWIQEPFRKDSPQVPLKGLWFGLFNPCPDGLTLADIYVCGSERFDPDSPSASWAVGPAWWPEGRYANSAVLADIYRIAYRAGSRKAEQKGCLGNDAEYPLVLAYGAFAVRALLGAVKPQLLLGKAKSLGIAVGFDSGDFVLLGELTDGGLRPGDRYAKQQEPPIEPGRKDM
jgi:hypothetical protein